jgi:hypothetical protein
MLVRYRSVVDLGGMGCIQGVEKVVRYGVHCVMHDR